MTSLTVEYFIVYLAGMKLNFFFFFQVLPVGMTQWFPKLTTCRWQSPRATSKCQAPHLGFPTTQTLHLSRLKHVLPLPQLTCHNIFLTKNESLSCA